MSIVKFYRNDPNAPKTTISFLTACEAWLP